MEQLPIQPAIKTPKVKIEEKHFVLGVLWEGDLELHSNQVKTKHSFFGERILHGDTVISILFAAFGRQVYEGKVDISHFQAAYQLPVYLNDLIWGEFLLKENSSKATDLYTFSFDGFKGEGDKICTGQIHIRFEPNDVKEVCR